MSNKQLSGITSLSVKEINKRQIYTAIYRKKEMSKADLVNTLNLSLSTVDTKLKQLLLDDLIVKQGFMQSTGGRKAQIYSINPLYRISIGLGVLKKAVHIVAVDLNGLNIASHTLNLAYENSERYFEKIALGLEAFIKENNFNKEKVISINVAVQGVLTPDGDRVAFGKILNNKGLCTRQFEAATGFKCKLYHDSLAAAFYEVWNRPDIDNAIFILLNRNLGGALILHGEVENGLFAKAGLIEHLCMDANGPLCYCGAKGCLETFCSSDALLNRAGENIVKFFTQVRKGQERELTLWHEYLKHLALAVRNINMLIDGKIILSGYLVPFFTIDGIKFLIDSINENSSFPIKEDLIILGNAGDYTPALGAAINAVDVMLKSKLCA